MRILSGILIATCVVMAMPALARIDEVVLNSPSLENAILETDVNRNIKVYLPPSYDAEPDKRYPVVYLLHGCPLQNSDWTGGLFDIVPGLDTYMQSHPDKEMIIVMPDMVTAYFCTWLSESPVLGNWQGFITEALVQ